MNTTEIRENLVKMLQELGNVQPVFNKTKYPDSFEEFLKKHEGFFTEINEIYLQAEDPGAFLDEIADAPAKAMNAEYEGLSKRKKEIVMMQSNLALVTYVFPCIMEYKLNCSQELAEKMAAAWNETFHTVLKVATYTTISEGFTRKWCFITTAVCENMGKADDCYELTTLRNYRDGYLAQQENGEAMIRHYYDIAPTIVKKIGRSADAEAVYSSIYSDYIVPCVKMIENGENEACCEKYRTMVEDLEKTYFFS